MSWVTVQNYTNFQRLVYTAHFVISAAFFSRRFNVFKFQICAEHWKYIDDLQQISVDCHWLRGLEQTATDLRIGGFLPRFHLLGREFRRNKLVTRVRMRDEKKGSRANVGMTDSPFWYSVMHTKYWPADCHFVNNACSADVIWHCKRLCIEHWSKAYW